MASLRAPRIAPRRSLVLGAVGTGAAAGFSALAVAHAHRVTRAGDEKIRRATGAGSRHPARRVAEAAKPFGKWYTYLPSALAVAAYVAATRPAQRSPSRRARERHERIAGAGAIAASGIAAYALGLACDRWLPQPPPPPGHRNRSKPTYPSGHAMGTGAVAFTAAYVLTRQRRARPAVAYPVAALLPLATTTSRMVAQKHWASDVLGGYLGATAIAAACGAMYEELR